MRILKKSHMKLTLACATLCLAALPARLVGQTPAASTPASPVPYSSVSELNLLLSDLDQASRNAQQDISHLRIEKWKTDANTKRGSQSDADSIQRNLQNALPEIANQLKGTPDSLVITFQMYRNLDALYGVFVSLTESAGAFGSKEDFQSLQNDLAALERSRRAFADRMDGLANSKETELGNLRTQLQQARAASQAAPAPAKKVVVDDTQPPPKKNVKKKVPKPPNSTPGAGSAPQTTSPAPQP